MVLLFSFSCCSVFAPYFFLPRRPSCCSVHLFWCIVLMSLFYFSLFRAICCVLLSAGLHLLLSPYTAAQQINVCTRETAPTCNPESRFRSLSGVCNNLNRPFLGAANTAFRRLIRPDYADGRSRPRESQVRGVPLPNPRCVITVCSHC